MAPLIFNSTLACLRSTRVISVGTFLYVTPKAISALCDRPAHSTDRLVDRLREKMAIFRDNLRTLLGDRTWFVLTEVVADNAWISFLVLSYLTHGAPLFINVSRGLDEASALFGLCSVAWLVRLGGSRAFGSLGD